MDIKQEDITAYIIRLLKDPVERFNAYGYDLYLPGLMRHWTKDHLQTNDLQQIERHFPAISPYFYDSAWELCRRGILRPGIKSIHMQSTPDGSSGNGYSITPFGQKWLTEEDNNLYVPTEEGRFSEMIEKYVDKFGQGFQQRSQEAIKCYGAHAYLACCAMAGAAAESILLNLAIQRNGDELEVLKLYSNANGTSKIKKLFQFDNEKDAFKAGFNTFFEIIKYWRDDASHGRLSEIKESEAFLSLALLLRVAQFSEDNYVSLTTSEKQVSN